MFVYYCSKTFYLFYFILKSKELVKEMIDADIELMKRNHLA